MTLAAASHNWDQYISENQKWRNVMAQQPDKHQDYIVDIKLI
jgi:hypothetical protein